MSTDPRIRVMKYLREQFHSNDQCLFHVGHTLDGINLSVLWTEQNPAISRKAFCGVIDRLEEDGICKWELELVCECERRWCGHPSKAPKHCMECGINMAEEWPDSYIPNRFTLDRSWAEARKWA